MRRIASILAAGSLLAVAAFGAAAAPARADVCVPGGVSLPCDPFGGLTASIGTNVSNPFYRYGLSFLAGTARRLYPVNQAQPGDPCHIGIPGDPCQPFLGSFVAFRALELTNAAVAGTGGYTCSSASVVAGTIRGMHSLYPADLFTPSPSPIQPGDPCHLLTPSP
jgi:hypothetical protein